ncbi:MAG: NBR1-Ig-like domain-containing protein [Brevefilum sp.]|nr:NBR1-Ig-like domain-containing protein [Brevefilum sp.]MDT8380630.1 NBR1-Ig-like domain-containing protein [Brevefilum sp.]
MKTNRIFSLLIFFALSALILTACNSGEPEIDIDAQRTGFAQTADVQATMTAQAQPTATNTPEPSPTPSFTDTPEVTETPEGTETSEVTTTETPQATATQQAASGTDSAAWIAQDPPDNTEFTPGEEFTITWSLENTGSSTWGTNYYIQFSSGEEMGATDEKVYLPYPVPPGTSVQISVDLVAPGSTGEKQSNWRLYNNSDNSFYEFYIIIDVVEDKD